MIRSRLFCSESCFSIDRFSDTVRFSGRRPAFSVSLMECRSDFAGSAVVFCECTIAQRVAYHGAGSFAGASWQKTPLRFVITFYREVFDRSMDWLLKYVLPALAVLVAVGGGFFLGI